MALTPDERWLALTAGRLFGVMATKAGQESPHPLRAVPFEGGVAVFRAVRGGGMILVGDDESVMFRASSYTFDRALEEFSAGERTQVESFGRG